MESDGEDGEEGRASTTLTGFLFGNVNKKGELEDDDVLDKESKRHLNGLTALGVMGGMMQEITDEDQTGETAPDILGGSEQLEKADTAVDYSDITEMAEEEEAKVKDAMASMKPPTHDNDDYDDDSDDPPADPARELMPPPSWIPTSLTTSSATSTTSSLSVSPSAGVTTSSSTSPGGTVTSSGTPGSGMTSPGKPKLNTPLAAMLPPELADKHVQDLFPEFREGKVLRFSRLFKPAHRTHLWKKKKKPASKTEDGETEDDGKKDGEEEKDGDEDSEEEEEDYIPFQLNMGRTPLPEELAQDDADAMTSTVEEKNAIDGLKKELGQDKKPKIAEWRYGPAQLWYDMLGVDDSGEDFDYGFRSKEEADEESGGCAQRESVMPVASTQVKFPDDAFHMVTQLHWEDDIIWNATEDVKLKVMQSFKTKGAAAGWIASSTSRTASQYLQQVCGPSGMPPQLKPQTPATPATSGSMPGFRPDLGLVPPGLDNSSVNKQDQWSSIFPVENDELLYGKWEDHVIWDARDLSKIPKPSVLTLDPNDENIILAIPEDRDPAEVEEEEANQSQKKEKEVRRSKNVLMKAGLIKDEEEDEEEEDEEIGIRDPFNISNDEYYNPKMAASDALRNNLGGIVMQHSTPAMELRQPFFPTHLGPIKLRGFHRNPLKRYSHGALASYGPHPVLPLLKHIKRKQKMREAERLASGGGEMFFMRTPEDLSGREGEIILAEYSEEYPPLMMQVGMATKIKNFYKRKPGKDTNPPEFKYGELAYAHTSPFLGTMFPGQCIQAFENNMFRSPIYQHTMPETDFLIIRNRTHLYIREIETILSVGQQCPLQEVPGPNSKKANNFIRDFLQVFIYRLFWKSKDEPRRIKMEEIKKAFPSHSESSIRKRLKLCADFKRTGQDSNWWVMKPDFRLPSEEEMRAMVSPEQCCGYYAMLAAEQRLKDAGYGEKTIFAIDDGDEDDKENKMDEEVRVAPWNTTRAYIQAMKGKCLLALTGVADPTGCGEGFSYVKVPNKPMAGKQAAKEDKDELSNTPQKKTVTGTDADLRRLNLKDAKQLLKKFGVPEHEIKKLSRWEVIDVVRTMSTEQAKAGQEGMTKFARGNRFSVAEHQERYKEECQRIFDLQNRVLSSKEVLSTDEESSDEEDSDFEEMGKNIENMLSNKKTSSQISHEREEAERRELQKMLRGEMDSKDKKKKSDDPPGVRKLIITRTFRRDDGHLYTRTEVVRKAAVIDPYVKVRQSRDDSFIRQFATLDDGQKEEMRKERRRLQEQLRRIQRNQERDKGSHVSPKLSKHNMPSTSSGSSSKKKKETSQLKLKCGACGQIGHMRTNKDCPLFAGEKSGPKEKPPPPPPVAITMEEEEELEKSNLLDNEDLINVEGTKMKFSKSLLEHAEQIKKQTLVLKVPKKMADSRKRRRAGTIIHCDYLKKHHQKTSNRRRADPVVTLSSIFEQILNEMRDMHGTQPFNTPVNIKHVPDYYNIIKKPMDLQTIRESIRTRMYKSRETFIMDVGQIVRNCEMYNGSKSVLTLTAQRMLDLCLQRIAEKEEKLMRLEKAINPLLDDNDIVAFSYILSTVVEERMKIVDNSYIFHKPVNKKFVKDYFDIVKKPMDLETLLKNIKLHRYKNVADFIEDVELIATNSSKYNGESSNLTDTAMRMVQICKDALKEQDEALNQLEERIRDTEQAALDAAETDSFITATSLGATQDGLELESIDGGSQKKSKRPKMDVQGTTIQNTSREDEFVDIEGDEEYSLANDLQITPENSEDEDATGVHHGGMGGKLSSEGSDSEHEMSGISRLEGYSGGGGDMVAAETIEEEYNIPAAVDDNALDYGGAVASGYGDAGGYAMTGAVAGGGGVGPGGEEDSFDPDAFFTSLQQQQQHQQQQHQGDGGGIATDLQLSDSEDEEEEVDEKQDSSFYMGEFLQ